MQSIITEIKPTGKTYRVGANAEDVLINLRTKRKREMVKKLNRHTKRRGGFLAYASKAYSI